MKIFSASIDPKIKKIDLHSFQNPENAMDFLEKELYKFYSQNERYCEIIHGIGEGILMKKVHNFLDKQPIIDDYQINENGGGTIVIFKV